MLLAAAAFALMTVMVRMLGAAMHPFEIAFFRNLFGLLFMAPWLMAMGMGALRTRHIGGYSLRSLFGLTAMLLWFSAVTMMPLAEAVALSFTAPLFAAIAAVLFLGERMGLRRTFALLAGFAGALIILRPGLIELTLPAGLVLASSVFIACSITMVKTLSRTEGASAIVTWMGIYMVPMSLVPALFVWRWPTLTETAQLVVMGGLATAGQVAMTRAYAATDATVVLPFDYARLPFAAAVAYFAFAEIPDLWTWVGAGVIATATIYMARREALVARRERRAGAGTVTLGAGGASADPPAPRGAALEAGLASERGAVSERGEAH